MSLRPYLNVMVSISRMLRGYSAFSPSDGRSYLYLLSCLTKSATKEDMYLFNVIRELLMNCLFFGGILVICSMLDYIPMKTCFAVLRFLILLQLPAVPYFLLNLSTTPETNPPVIPNPLWWRRINFYVLKRLCYLSLLYCILVAFSYSTFFLV